DVSPDIPWHVTAFHQDYKMTSPADTRPQDLLRAAAIGREAGLRYIYAGNLPGRVEGLEDTHCHQCGELLIQRYGYSIATIIDIHARDKSDKNIAADRLVVSDLTGAGPRLFSA